MKELSMKASLICTAAAGLVMSAQSLAQALPPGSPIATPLPDGNGQVFFSPPWSALKDRLLPGEQDPSTLIITVEFGDRKMTYGASDWAERLFSTDPDAKTLQHYFAAASYGKVSMTPAEETNRLDDDGVIGPIRLLEDTTTIKPIAMLHPNTGSEAADPVISAEIFRQAVIGADPFIDYARFDQNDDQFIDSSELAIFVVAAGHGASFTQTPAMRSHAVFPDDSNQIVITSDMTTPTTKQPVPRVVAVLGASALISELSGGENDLHPTTMGTFAHEAGHFVFGLPDLYDSDPSHGEDSGGIGDFGLMGTGSGGTDSTVDSYVGETPPLPSAWSLVKLAWATADSNFVFRPLTATGAPGRWSQSSEAPFVRVGLAQAGSTNADTGDVDCLIDEYFLVQYRTAEGYDRGLNAVLDRYGNESSGVVIYHVNEGNSSNEIAHLKLLDVEESVTFLEDLGSSTQGGQTWLDGSGTPYLFDADSSASDSRLDSGEESGVEVTVGLPTVNAENGNAVALTIDSLCDDTGRSVR